MHDGQRSHASGFAAQATAYVEDEDGTSFTFTPFYRYDAGDSERTHADVRDAYVLMYGDLGDDEWELRLGVDRVFWGVVESRPLVDIVNQTDLVEHPDEKTKLGQPMAHVTWSGEWGALEFFGLTWHRPRTFPGRTAACVPGNSSTTREPPTRPRRKNGTSISPAASAAALGRSTSASACSTAPAASPPCCRRRQCRPSAPNWSWHRTTRKSASMVWTPRSPRASGCSSWRPYTVPARKTAGPIQDSVSWSCIRHSDTRRRTTRPSSRASNTRSIRCGESEADLSLIAEWAHDERGERATNAFESDILLAARLGLNDEEGTEFILSILESLEYSSRVLSAEFKRRLTDSWSLHVEGLAYAEIEEEDVMYSVRRGSFIAASLAYSF